MRKSLSILLLCATVGMVSCEKNDAPEPKEPVVYMAGTVDSKDVQYAAIWKNGAEIATLITAVSSHIALVGLRRV